MKRPAGLWLLLSVGVLSLIFRNASGIRATSLIFSKSTSTTTESNDGDENSPLSEEAVTEASTEKSNTTKPTLTGNPQIDYVHDPNLPQELNGYNLSEYPFYERVPDSEEFDFKCDGLHDGFYASIPHKCQVYHHCLFGTRYDFLCANYTAFDQRTFICQFVSEVDCVNSKKFWHRNDALYQAASTTTAKPIVTPPPQIPPQSQPAGGAPLSPSRPTGIGFGGGRRRYPPRRRRPQYDYYYDDDYEDDDYYDDPPPRRRRVRPRRPVYEDEYDYDEKTASRSNGDEKRRPYDRRRPDMRRNKDRRKQDDHDYDIEEDEKRRPGMARRKRPNEKRRPLDDEQDRRIERPRKGSRRPIYDDDEYEEDYIDNNERINKKPNGHDSENKDKSVKPTGGSSIYNRPRVAPKIKPPVPKTEANKFSYNKSTPKITTTNTRNEEDYYDYDETDEEKLSDNDNSQIKRPQKEEHRITEKQVGAASKKRNHAMRPDYDEDDHKLKHDSVRSVTRNGQNSLKSRRREPQIEDDDEYYDEDIGGKESNIRIKDKPSKENSEEVISEQPTSKRYERPMYTKIRRPTTTDRYDEIRNESEKVTPGLPEKESQLNKDRLTTESPKLQDSTVKQEKGSRNKNNYSMYRNRNDISTTTSTAPTTVAKVQPESSKTNHIRIIKRPFLPSRGGNPYVPRGLQPIGLKVDENTSPKDIKPSLEELFPINNNEDTDEEERTQKFEEESKEFKEKPFKASPMILKVPARQYMIPKGSENENEKPKLITLLKQDYKEQVQQESAGDERVPLDIDDTEYDVTLNDALNPTLPNIPLYKDDYSQQLDYYRRNRYLVDPIVQSTNINQHQIPYYQQTEQFSNPVRTHKFTVSPAAIGYSSGSEVTQNNHQMKTTPVRPQHTQAFYTSY